jgi:hypothetical protein
MRPDRLYEPVYPEHRESRAPRSCVGAVCCVSEEAKLDALLLQSRAGPLQQ